MPGCATGPPRSTCAPSSTPASPAATESGRWPDDKGRQRPLIGTRPLPQTGTGGKNHHVVDQSGLTYCRRKGLVGGLPPPPPSLVQRPPRRAAGQPGPP